MLTKVVWRSATAMNGEQCVMTNGPMLMLELPVDSWDMPILVRTLLYAITAHIFM